MDRRLSSEAERTYNDGRTLFARNAGGLPGGLKNTIKKALGENGNVKEIILMPHTDCGAMGAVFKCLMQGEKFDQDVLDGLVRYFENKPIQSREELENTLNGNECMREIVDIRKSVHGYEKKQIKITLEVVPLIASPPLPGEHNNV
ncbi:MAG: hypothetical protein KGH49_01720, partial [Candidatus Micrarchaeota archaeon]|nr:hypothetical protein [Candidatus Micrarchaeota archaeon]